MTIQNAAAPAGGTAAAETASPTSAPNSRDGLVSGSEGTDALAADADAAAARDAEDTPEYLRPSDDDHEELSALKATHLATWRKDRQKQTDQARKLEELSRQSGDLARKAQAFDDALKLPEFRALLAKAATGEIASSPAAPRVLPRRKLSLPESTSSFEETQVEAVADVARAVIEQELMEVLAPYRAFIEQQAQGSAQTEQGALEQKYGKELVTENRDLIAQLRAKGLTAEQALMAATNGQAALVASRRAAAAPAANATPVKTSPPLGEGKQMIFGKKDEKTGKWVPDKAALAAHLRKLPGADALYRPQR